MLAFPTTVLAHEEDCGLFGESLASLLQKRFAHNPSALEEIQRKLREGSLVIIRDALPVELADRVHQELDAVPTSLWKLNEGFLPSGFCFRHHNLYDWSSFPPVLNATLQIFHHPDTLQFMSDLSGRNCYGDSGSPPGSASWYMPGDYSLPHNDHVHHRTVAYVWHLSKNWRPEWGGALYWAANGQPIEEAFAHASYNTLVLFSVTTFSSHMVTAVSPPAQGKRLTVNGWWSTNWKPNTNKDPMTIIQRLQADEVLADLEFSDIRDALKMNGPFDPHQLGQIQTLLEQARSKHYPRGTTGIY